MACKKTNIKSGVFRNEKGDIVTLSNGIISCSFKLSPNCATVGFDNLITGESVLRGVKPEARIILDAD